MRTRSRPCTRWRTRPANCGACSSTSCTRLHHATRPRGYFQPVPLLRGHRDLRADYGGGNEYSQGRCGRLHSRDDETGVRGSGATRTRHIAPGQEPPRCPGSRAVQCASWNAGSNACIAPRSRICSPAPPILNACRSCLSPRGLPPHFEHVRSRRLGGERVRHGDHETYLSAVTQSACRAEAFQTPVASAIKRPPAPVTHGGCPRCLQARKSLRPRRCSRMAAPAVR